MTKQIFYPFITLYFIVSHLLLFSCGGRNPNLSEKKLRELLVDTVLADIESPELFSEKENNISSGIAYKENRSVDPARPPVTIDIETAVERMPDISLNSIAKNVHYIMVDIPKGLHVQDFVIRDDTLFVSCRDQMATRQCVFAYSNDGTFLNIVWEITLKEISKKYHPDIEKEAIIKNTTAQNTRWSSVFPDFTNKQIIFNVKFDNTGKQTQYNITQYNEEGRPSRNTYITKSLNGGQSVMLSSDVAQRSITCFHPAVGWCRVFTTADVWL